MTHEKEPTILIAFDDFEIFDPSEPERGLLLAVLLSAIHDLRKPGELNRRAMEYLLSPEDQYLFSFLSVCNFLNIDPERFLYKVGLRKTQRNFSTAPVRH
jgi:hypothetical protein